MSDIKVSIIMPVYNTGIYLKTAVESILSQSLKELELIIVDDGSTDGSSERCDEYALHDSRVVVLHQKNGGICNARNVALKIAKGEFIAFCDHDDEYRPGLLENSYKRAVETNADVLKFCKKEYWIRDGKRIRTKFTTLEDKVFVGKESIQAIFFYLINRQVLECVWDAFFRREFIAENKFFFDESYKMGGEDIDFFVRILTKCEVFVTMKEIYYMHYTRFGFSTSSKFSEKNLITARRLAERITVGTKELGIDINNHKPEYIYQIMFVLFDVSANIISNPLCKWSKSVKIRYMGDLKKEPYLPSWFFDLDAREICAFSHKVGLIYFLLKHNLYLYALLVFKIRTRYLTLKGKI